MADIIPSDAAILDLLRKQDAMTIAQLSEALGVTATAVRQRLTRLMGQGFVERVVCREGRGRPSHQYLLTVQGRRKTGANFADLAVALWQEIRSISNAEVRAGLLRRISGRLAALYGAQIRGDTVEERMSALAALMAERQIPFEVTQRDSLPILNALACPYPELAEMDRGVCAMERLFLSELLGQDVKLDQCRLDGDSCCTFQVHSGTSSAASPIPVG